MKRVNTSATTFESGCDSDDEFIDSSSSPQHYCEFEHVTSRKKRRGVIEKRRRDRINHSLMELRRLVPQAISKEGSTKLEKAEILQMTVEHLRSLQQTNKGLVSDSFDAILDSNIQSWTKFDSHASGFRECIDEVSRYLVAAEGFDVQHPLRLRLISHLECFTERSISPSSSSPIDIDHSTNLQTPLWPTIVQQPPSAFATPPPTTPAYYHHSNPTFNMHFYQQQRPPADPACQPPSCV